jgi:predicted DNA-binding transcriptional regulator AlpA
MLLRMEAQTIATTDRQPHKPRRPYEPNSQFVTPFYLPYVVGFTATTAWRLRKQGLFPEPIRVSPGRVGWKRSTLEAWLNERQQKR